MNVHEAKTLLSRLLDRVEAGEEIVMRGHTIFSRACTIHAPPNSPSVVLVHGYVASSRYMIPLMHELASYCRTFAPDLPGWGESSKPAQTLSLTQLSEVLAAWVSACGLERPIFLGNSLGCQIVAELAVRYPNLPSGLILLGPTVDPQARSVLRQAARLALDGARERPSLWLLELWDLFHMGLPRASQILRVMLHDRIEDKLPAIAVPSLVVRGSRDPVAPQRWAEEASTLLPRGELALLPGAGHAANYSAPRCLTEAILPFIRRVSAHSSDQNAMPLNPLAPET